VNGDNIIIPRLALLNTRCSCPPSPTQSQNTHFTTTHILTLATATCTVSSADIQQVS